MTMKRESHAKITEMNECGWNHTVVQHTVNIDLREDKEHNSASAWTHGQGQINRPYGTNKINPLSIHCKKWWPAILILQEQIMLLRQELQSLLDKEAIEHVPPPVRDSGFYICYFLVPKKDMGLHPFLELCLLNRFLQTYRFKMYTLKFIVSQIQSKGCIHSYMHTFI